MLAVSIKGGRKMTTSKKAFIGINLLFVIFISAAMVYGQEEISAAQLRFGMGYFMGGVGMFSESGNNSIIYSVGGGGHSLKNRFIIGGEGHSSFGTDNAGGYGFFDIGYAVLISDTLVLYPLIGIGGGAMTRPVDPSVSSCALLNPAVGFDYLIHRKSKSGILLGLRLGYIFTLYSDTWDWSMPYIRILIGGFGVD
jgi:hypothetical protein